MTAPDFNSMSVRADTVTGKTYTEAEVQALVAAAVMEAADTYVRGSDIAGAINAWDYYEDADQAIRALIRPDAMSALEAYRDREVTRALREAAQPVQTTTDTRGQYVPEVKP